MSGSAYTRELVELLIPTIWDAEACWGLTDERKPDIDMPKSKAAKNEANTLWAHLIDIRIAWDRTGEQMTLEEAQAVVLCGGLGYPYADAGKLLGANKSTVMRRYERGVGILLDQLNGTSIVDQEQPES